MKISSGQREWGRYKNGIWMLPASAAVVVFLAFFFYRSLLAIPPLAGIGVLCFRNLSVKEKRRREQELSAQFRECILAVATLLQAGYSAENAFVECRQDMVLLYGEEAMICRELGQLRRGLHINISLEELLTDMAKHSDCAEILQFAQIFALAKRNGGGMPEIIRDSAEVIGRRIELRQEMETLLSGKRMELTIMRLMPFGILLYIELGNPGYFQVLYHNWRGVLMMTGCLGMYLVSYMIGERIMNRLWEEIS